jgi:hypothetical protein
MQSHASSDADLAPDVWVKLLHCCVQSPECSPLLTAPLFQMLCQGAQGVAELEDLRRAAGVLAVIGGATGDRAAVQLHLEVMALRH